MGKDKLRKFAENLTFDNLVQLDFDEVFHKDHPLKGHWGADFFGRRAGGNPNAPIVLELGCGKGEYTVGLGAAYPDKNFIGIDIKGARMWRGAKTATELGLANVGFLRTRIEFINSFFGERSVADSGTGSGSSSGAETSISSGSNGNKGEVSEIWITFPDPQLKKGREKKRLTSPVFLAYYARFLAPDGVIHLKTDSRELHDYTLRVIEANNLPCEAACADIYGQGFVETEAPFAPNAAPKAKVALDSKAALETTAAANPKAAPDPKASFSIDPTLSIKTTYERRFLAEGKPITYLRFGLGGRTDFTMIYDE